MIPKHLSDRLVDVALEHVRPGCAPGAGAYAEGAETYVLQNMLRDLLSELEREGDVSAQELVRAMLGETEHRYKTDKSARFGTLYGARGEEAR